MLFRSFIFDILCTVDWLVLAVRYARKGFLASVVQLTGSLISLFGAKAFSGWAAGQVFERFLAGSFRDQIAANIAAGGAVSLDGIAQRYAGFLPEAFRASIVDACERSISAVLNDNAVVLADTIVQKVLAPLLHSRDTVLNARDRKSTRLNSSHKVQSRMPSSA